MAEYGLNIKYIDSCYDSRDNTVWNVTFRGFGNDIGFRTNQFSISDIPAGFNYASLFEWVLDYLKGNFTDKKILNDCRLKN